MIAAILLLILGIWSAMAAINAFRPFRQTLLLFPSMTWSWLVIGLSLQQVAFQMVLAALLVWWGALDQPVGRVGAAILAAAWCGHLFIYARSRRSKGVVDTALADADIPRSGRPVSWWRTVLAVPIQGREIEKTSSVAFHRVAGRTLSLDVYQPSAPGSGRPVLLYVHGGAWTVGSRREQGLPLLQHLARNGWVCVSADYRLSPGATFPDHLVDVKAALAWIRRHGAEYGADPSFVAISGGSAGGHLAALAGLTENDPRYQPGFEASDTSVQSVVPIYGVYDTTNRLGAQTDEYVTRLMEPLVINAFLSEEPGRFAEASPLDRIHPNVPPFLVIQGDDDTLAPVIEARAFVDELGLQSTSDVVYMEFPGAQHIFDLFYSYQSARMVEGVLAFLDYERTRFLESTPNDQPV